MVAKRSYSSLIKGWNGYNNKVFVGPTVKERRHMEKYITLQEASHYYTHKFNGYLSFKWYFCLSFHSISEVENFEVAKGSEGKVYKLDFWGYLRVTVEKGAYIFGSWWRKEHTFMGW